MEAYMTIEQTLREIVCLKIMDDYDAAGYCSHDLGTKGLDVILNAYEKYNWLLFAPDAEYYGKEILAEFSTGYEVVIPDWAGYKSKDGIAITGTLIRWRPL